MKKFIDWFWICIWVLGTIGGLGYTVWLKQYVIAAAIVGLAIMAWDKFKACWKDINE